MENLYSIISTLDFSCLAFCQPAKRDFKPQITASLTEKIPQELWVHQILVYLDPKTLCRIAMVCKRWNIYVNHDALWKRLLLHDYKVEIRLKDQSLKLVYKNLKTSKKNSILETNKTRIYSFHNLLKETYYLSSDK